VKSAIHVYRNLLASTWGRSAAFFSFFFIDGVLIAFGATFIAAQMRAAGVDAEMIGYFVATLYLPASWKILFGPVVDLCYWERFGRRRCWMLGTEALMIVTLMIAMPIDFVEHFYIYVALMMLVNLFAAMQRVAVCALACTVLSEEERGAANGMMWTGGWLGQIIGGAGAFFLSKYMDLHFMYFVVAGVILLVMLLVALPLREPKTPARDNGRLSGWGAVVAQVRNYAVQAYQAFRGSRAAAAGLLFVLLPAGAISLSLATGTNLMVEFGMSEDHKSLLQLVSVLVSAAAALTGGYFADWFGRRTMLVACIVGSALPTLGLAYALHQAGWIMPVDPPMAGRPVPPQSLVVVYWATSLISGALLGLLYSARSTMFMDISTPAVAATQFTAYMALINLVISFSSAWQGWTVKNWGYPSTLVLDTLLGMVCLPLLLLMSCPKAKAPVINQP
jgi:PAT family beta-lactamase induction signal transducer AmpG